jgi:hypothetical protein
MLFPTPELQTAPPEELEALFPDTVLLLMDKLP